MAEYTIELRDLVELYPIGLNDYPIYDPSYRDTLNKRIIDHFYFREIGFESPEIFINRLNHTMRLRMPYHNQFYRSTLLDFEPLNNMVMEITNRRTTLGDMKRIADMMESGSTDFTSAVEELARDETNATTDKLSESNTDSTNITGSKSRAVASQFPQTMLNQREDYASSANDAVSDTEATSHAEVAGRESGTDKTTRKGDTSSSRADATKGQTSSKVDDSSNAREQMSGNTLMRGRNMSAATLLEQFRDTILNVDEAVLADLEPLFMQVWKNNDSYSRDTERLAHYVLPYFRLF